ncbi:hypothetical protein ACFSTD_11595 [Novosphingobium colocasiae]|uniref:Elongation factor P n=1 Tax=Novosphingobium colocasiae TaxID=1256513 RepID=A0A918PBI0_9SPHN|nr:hypothetical protein [Novosphingobium colocasiae]GGY96860.1 hypothetical protein GCM10011614_09740 [Novosphingobium colocasiae]
MRCPLPILPLLALAATTAPGLAAADTPPPVAGGRIGTLAKGSYTCETPGDVTGAVGIVQKDLAFSIVNGSNYKQNGKAGSYLLTDDIVTLTGGPLNGSRFRRVSRARLQLLDLAGKPSAVRCVLSGPMR